MNSRCLIRPNNWVPCQLRSTKEHEGQGQPKGQNEQCQPRGQEGQTRVKIPLS